MLVFTRKVGETIVIGGDIAVTIVRVGPNDVRLGIEAPDATPIARDDVAQRHLKETKRADRSKGNRPRMTTHSSK